MKVSSNDFQNNAVKMISNASEAFDCGNYISQLSYLFSAKQDIENAIDKAKLEFEQKCT